MARRMPIRRQSGPPGEYKTAAIMAEVLRQVMKQLVGILRGKEDPAQLFQSRRFEDRTAHSTEQRLIVFERSI